jgi:pantoate--beta-alanine ligase
MKVFAKISDIKHQISTEKKDGFTIGFVPTMGTLHEGHLSLIRQSKKQCDKTVCSIFVNPIQFNNKEDLEKYPRMFEQDKALLEKEGCDIIFNPTEKEIYPEEITEKYDFGRLEKVMEGAFRPGHFNGVAVVVKRLFDIVEPHISFFGEKDFQQLAIIRNLVDQLRLPIKIVGCEIIREKDGLAMSSRNLRLNEEERAEAPYIYEQLKLAKNLVHNNINTFDVKGQIIENFKAHPNFRIEYFEIADPDTLEPIANMQGKVKSRAFIAAFLGKIRLIDNIEIYS